MSVNPIEFKEIDHSSCELRISNLEAGLKNHEELLEAFDKQLNEVKSKLVTIFSYL